jgi:integrase
MPTINAHKAKDGTITYRARVRLKGYPTQTATFPTRQEARRYAEMVNGQMLAGKHFPTKIKHTLTELLERYTQEVLPRKRPETQRREGYILAFWNTQLGSRLLGDITKAEVVKVRDEFVKRGAKATTVHRYLNLLSHVFNTAIRDYDWLEANVVALVRKPSLPPGRIRYLTDQERARLLQECRRSKNPYIYSLVILAMHTGLRRGNLVELRKRDIDLKTRTVCVARTKNATALVLPLVGEAYAVMKERCAQIADAEFIFPHSNEQYPRHSYRRAFTEAMKRAGIEDATFHTLRHCCGSYLVQAGVDLYTVSRILNHKNMAMTARYSHLQIDQLKDALETLSQRLSS